jgi:hypothetical protein
MLHGQKESDQLAAHRQQQRLSGTLIQYCCREPRTISFTIYIMRRDLALYIYDLLQLAQVGTSTIRGISKIWYRDMNLHHRDGRYN